MARDDFSPNTKETIAQQAGYLCSFPGCGNITIGPNDSNSSKTSSTGMACHISAASSGKNAKRYDANLTSTQRSHAENGIWMCYKHGKIVDNDETRYTAGILMHWKGLAREVFHYMHEQGVEYSEALRYLQNRPLAKNVFIVDSLGDENSIIGDALIDSCIHISWGNKLMDILREFLIEITRNAFIHGKASSVKFDFEGNRLILYDNGNNYNINSLLNEENGHGGKLTFEYLNKNYGKNLVVTSIRENDLNKTTISLIKRPKEIFNLTSCAIEITRQEFKYGVNAYKIDDACNELFIVLPKYLTPSDLPRTCGNALDKEERSVIFVGERLSELSVHLIKEKYPDSKIINIE